MKLTFDIIKNRAEKAKKHPKFKEKSKAVGSISGAVLIDIESFPKTEKELISQLDGAAAVLLLSPDDLLGNGTLSGTSNNACFDNDIVSFLKKSNVTDIFVAVMHLEDKGYVLLGAEMNISEKGSEKLSRLVSKKGGSWREDVGTEAGWSSFETE